MTANIAEVARSSSSQSSDTEEESGNECCVPNESLRSFITDSPFSFRNPIFFSVPRDQQNHNKQVNPVINSKRQLFFGDLDESRAHQLRIPQ